MCNLCLERYPLRFLSDLIQIYTIFVSERIEDVHVLYRIFASLLISVNEVNPMIDILRNIPTLQLLPKLSNKNIRIFIRPKRQRGIIDFLLILGQTIAVIIFIDEHLWQGVNLWNQLSYICCTRCCISPRTTITVKNTIRAVKLSTLKCQCTDTVWPNSDQKVEYYGRTRVMCTKVVFTEELFFVYILIFL